MAPKKKINNSLDKLNLTINNEDNISEIGLNEAPSKPESKLTEESKNTTLVSSSPDGKYNFVRRSDKADDYLEERVQNIPMIKIPGYVVAWPTDVKANSLYNMHLKGWDFVPPSILEQYNANKKISAGTNKAGEQCYHYAMYISESKWKELQARESAERLAKQESMKIAPNPADKAIYGTEQMSFSRSLMAPKVN